MRLLFLILFLILKVQSQSTAQTVPHLEAKKDSEAILPSSCITETTEVCLLIALLNQFCHDNRQPIRKIYLNQRTKKD